LDVHSFPTRRSSDLLQHGADAANKVKSSFTNVFAGKKVPTPMSPAASKAAGQYTKTFAGKMANVSKGNMALGAAGLGIAGAAIARSRKKNKE